MSFYHDLIRLCDSITSLTGISVCIYDDSDGLTADAAARDRSYFGHYCEFCRAMRDISRDGLSGRDACIACDERQVREYASHTKTVFFHKCHAGLTELIIPLWLDERPIGLAFLGQCAVEGRDDEKEIIAAAVRLGGDAEGFRRIYHQMPHITPEQLLAAGNLAQMSLAHLIGSYRELTLPKGGNSLARQCESYLRSNFRLPINAASAAEALHVNQSYLSRVFRRDMGCSILTYLNEQRLRCAKSLLSTTTLPISVIAENAGFSDSSYFTRFFSKAVGMTPGEYRRSERKE